MMPEKAVQEFQELYFRRFGVKLSDAEAREQAGNLLRLYRILLIPSGPKEDPK